MKKIGLLLVAGLIPVLAVALFMNFISLNLGYSLLVGMGMLFLVSLWQNKNTVNPFLKIIVIAAPLSVAYYLLIIQELPGLWIAIPLFILTVVAGIWVKKQNRALFLGAGIMLTGVLVAFMALPGIISGNLSEKLNRSAPAFELENVLTAEKITNKTLEGKVVVLDFFGTWCLPCIAEMAELKAIKTSLSDYEDQLTFIIACTDVAGDTPEKAKKFHADRELPFDLMYDYNSVTHKKFEFTGVPGLVIIDKKGNIRLKHEGYNEAENLQKTLMPLLRELLEE